MKSVRRIVTGLADSGGTGASTIVMLAALALAVPLVSRAYAAIPVPSESSCTPDVQGANDQPGQKDLTKFCVELGDGSGYDLITKWNWDLISLSGGNTGDACSLYDKNGNGLVDFAICVTIQGNPAAQAPISSSPRAFSCSDKKPDRCTDFGADPRVSQ